MKLFFNTQENFTLLRIVYEGTEWQNLERKYVGFGFKKEVLPYVLNDQNEEIECYTHDVNANLRMLLSRINNWLGISTIDSLKRELVYQASLNIAIIRVIPEQRSNTHEVYLQTKIEITPLIYNYLAKFGSVISKEVHSSVSDVVYS